ncbi:hypothetical protein [Dysgonomonas sp. 520]|uniref:hypothetical protein n=1 Tax=Dysgonomonas sp. 520 TaxID=2302931 RepID=UPI0013D06C48|nr:hypothetical protein [Dysgonomonas sp. 520]NDW10470.1 hypothetical protein [Dysgonomonas sp. 520]
MNARDQSKLCVAGWVIYRKEDSVKPIIKFKSKSNPDSWKKFEEYPSKAQRDRSLNMLLKAKNAVED